jgi:hypothetical protein
VIVFQGVPHSIPCTELAINGQTFLDDPILLSAPYVVQSDASPDAFVYLMEILNGSEPQFSPQITHDLMLLARESGHNGLIATFAPQPDVPSHQENVRDLEQGLDRVGGGATLEANLLSIRDSFAVPQRDISAIRGSLNGDLEGILSKLEKVAPKVTRLPKNANQLSKHLPRCQLSGLQERRSLFAPPVTSCSEISFNGSIRISLWQCIMHRYLISSA